MSDQRAKPPSGFLNKDPSSPVARWLGWSREGATSTVTADRAAAGWRPMIEVPKNRYVALLFRGGNTGDFEGSCAYCWEDGNWHAAGSAMIFDATNAIAWKRWTRASVTAEATPPKGRRG